MFKIGEFSKLTQVSIRMLRYYDEIGLLKPILVDEETGYRMYGVNQIPILNKIIYLRDSGFQTAEIQSALQSETGIMILLNQKEEEIKQEIALEKQKLKKIEIARNALKQEEQELHFQISIKTVPSYYVLSIRETIQNYYAEGELWLKLAKFAKRNHIDASQTSFSIYHDVEYKEKDVDVELCVPVNKEGLDQEGFRFYHTPEVARMATMMVYGDFSNIAKAYLAFANWIQTHSEYEMEGTSRQIVHRGPWNEVDVNQYVIELQIPLKN